MTIAPHPHPLVVSARRLADDLLAPHAERVDQEGVPATHLEAIRRSGLLGLNAPEEHGGAAASVPVAREVAEILAGACCSTWFVQTQHHTPVITLSKSEGPVRDRLLGPLARGELLSGVAYAHLRAYPGPRYGSPGSGAACASTAPCPGIPAGASTTSCSWPG